MFARVDVPSVAVEQDPTPAAQAIPVLLVGLAAVPVEVLPAAELVPVELETQLVPVRVYPV